MPRLLFQKLKKIFKLKIVKTSFFEKLLYIKLCINSTKLNPTTYCTITKSKALNNHQNYNRGDVCSVEMLSQRKWIYKDLACKVDK